jgi:hypothetical protein
MKLRFDSLPHSFSMMKKRAISIIAGDGSHFISYLAVNFGAHFQEENSTNRDSTFIANIDSGNGSVNMHPFIQWLYAVIYELEVWVTQFLNTSALGLIERPYLAKIGRKCKRQIQSKEHIVCSIPITRVTRAPTQEDTCNCGIYSLLNTRAVGGPKNGSWKSACRASRLYTEQVFTGVNSKLAWRAARLQSSCTGVHSRTRQRSAMVLTINYANLRSDGA